MAGEFGENAATAAAGLQRWWRRRPLRTAAGAAVLVVALVVVALVIRSRISPSPCPPSSRALEGVYNPARLTVLDSCRRAAGVVTAVRPDEDGDLHLTVRVDPAFGGLANEANRHKMGGDLVVEFMPRDRGRLPAPPVGAHVELLGALVVDERNGWRELHPVWREVVNGRAYRSGPQYGGDAATVKAGNAVAACRTDVGEPCHSYAGTPASEAFVAVTSPRPGATVSGLVALGARTSARGDPTRVKWYLDGVEIGWARSGPQWSDAWNSASAREGPHRLFAKARIEGGGWETSRAIEVIVANRAAGAATQPSALRPGAAPSCSMRRAAPATWQHVVWIVFENKQYSQVIGSPDAPYINALAGQCGLATNFSAEAHPSLPNYIAMTSGSPQGISDDGGPSAHPLAVPSIFSQLGGGGWRALQESMPAKCALGNSGFYAVRHNPAAYYTNIRSDCAGYDVPLGASPDLSARFTFVTPDICHDMHSSSCGSTTSSEVRNGDAWLAGFLPKLLASPQYQAGTTAVFITWDEDDYGGKQHIPTLVVAPSVRRGTRSARPFDHYSLLRTTEEMLKLRPFLGHAASAASMRRAFNL